MKPTISAHSFPRFAGLRRLALLCVLLGLSLAAAHAQLPSLPGLSFGANNSFTYDDPDDPGPAVTGFLRVPATVNGHGVIICHGKGGSATNFNTQHAANLMQWGFVCIVPQLTHAGAGSTPDNEGYCPNNSAIGRACLKILAATPGVDMTRIAMFGHSMGSYFTGGFCGENPAPYPAIRAAVEGAGGMQSGAGNSGFALPTAAEVAGITAPMLLFHGTGDNTYPGSVALKASLDAHAVPNRLLLYQGVPHGILDSNQKRTDAYAISRAWYTQHGVLSFPGNTAPAISAPASVAVTAGVSSAPIAIVVNDAETAPGSLTVQAFSLDADVAGSTSPPVAAYSGLLQNSELVLGGTGTNRTLTLSPAAGKNGTVEVALVVTDGTAATGQLASVTYLAVTISGGAPVFTFGSSQGGTSLTGQESSPLSITLTASGANAPVTWSLTGGALPAGVTLGSDGVLAGTPTQAGAFNFTVQAVDAGSASGSQAYTVTIASAPPPFTFGSSQGGTSLTGQEGSPLGITLTASGATAPVTWTLAGGALPTGVTLDSGGVLVGAPTQSGAFSFTVQAVDANNTSATQAYTLAVAAAPGAVNHRPTATWIPDLRVAPGAAVPPQNFTVGDDQTPAGSLTITRGSTNQTLLPINGIVLGGSGANRTVTLNPATGVTGRATVFLTVTDGGGKSSVTAFTLTVAAAVAGNTAPSLQGVPNDTIVTGSAYGPLVLVVKDTESAENTLTLSSATTNPTLVPAGAIVFGPSNPAQQNWGRTVTVNPAPGQTGRAVITLSVSDGTNTTSTAFVLDVVAGNTPPSLLDLATFHAEEIGTAPQPVTFTLSDSETGPADLLVTASSSNPALVPSSDIVLGGSGPSRTVTLTPVSSQRGAARITLAVSDGDIVRRRDFLYVVTDPAAPSEQFARSRGVFILDSAGGTAYTTTFGKAIQLRDGSIRSHAHVDGFTLRVSWDDVESDTTPGSYDFFIIRNLLNKLPAGQQLSIIITPGEPAYLAAGAAATWNDGGTPRAVPWDPFIRARRHALIEAMAAYEVDGVPLGRHPRLTVLDPYLPGGHTGIRNPSPPTNTLASFAGYTRQKLLETVQDELRLMQDSFPGKRIQIGFFTVEDSENASYVGQSSHVWLREQLLAEFNGVIRPRVGFFMELLAARRASPAVDPYTATPISGFAAPMFAAKDEAWGSFQMLGSWTRPFNDGHVNNTLNGHPADAMEYAYNTYNSEYTEVYIGDIDSLDFRPALQSWHDFLASRPIVANAPVISAVADQSIPVNGAAGPLAFTVGDAETAAAGLAVVASSSNQALLPDANIVLGGAGTGRTVTITPVAGQTGSATVTLTVSDGASSTPTSFVLTVVNSAPVANPLAVGLLEDGGPVPVTLTGSDPENMPLIFTVLSSPGGGILSGTAPNLLYTPAANANGGESFSYKASDGLLDSEVAQVSLSIMPVNDAPSFSAGASQTVPEDAGPQSVAGWATAISAGPANEAAQSTNFIVSSDNGALFSAPPAISPAGTLSYTPAADASGTAQVTVQLVDDGGTANGGIDTSPPQTFAITVTPVTDVPQSLTATAVSPTEIDVNWSAVPEAVTYELQRKTGAGDFATVYQNAATLFADTGLTPETTYTYQVRAQSVAGDSDWSAPATATTLPPPTLALVRHGLTLNGRIDGRVQVLLGENITLNGGAAIAGDLLVPGTPVIRVNGGGSHAGVVDGTGSASPTGYQITLNGGSSLGFIKRRTDPVALPTVAAPPAPVGTVNVTLNNSSQSVSNWATLRNLTLNGNTGAIAVPPGTYGSFTANGSSSFVLGVEGAAEPSVYNLQGLTLNGSSQIQVVGPVVLTLGAQLNANGSAGNAAHPEWLVLNVASGGVTLNGNVTIHGRVVAPSGTVIVNGGSRIIGSVASDRLTINGNGVVQPATP